ncbi:hypothetical protein V6N13_032614 [Hibiscus sabdariffa]|uniref:Pre-nudix hydrolase domain-containing protein n=2 Tax=Hibiscus sabdariffa TaxID=183260 RepID=A0ABR2A359_9ROSI
MSASTNSTPVNEKDKQILQDFKLLHADGGVAVEVREPLESVLFTSMLRASVAQWRQQGEKGVWIKLPIQHANLVEPAVKEGFWNHHAEPNYLMLCYWIPEGTHTLPADASHRWMPFEEYASQPFVQKYELLKYIVDICLAKKETIPYFLLCLPLRHSRMKRVLS